jgi:hypothetical protein
MNLLKATLLAAVLGVSFLASTPAAKADHNPYWRGHWGWYNNTYRPYYHRSYYSNPGYGYYGGGYYQPYGYYGNNYYRGGGYYGGGAVNVGPLNIGWW